MANKFTWWRRSFVWSQRSHSQSKTKAWNWKRFHFELVVGQNSQTSYAAVSSRRSSVGQTIGRRGKVGALSRVGWSHRVIKWWNGSLLVWTKNAQKTRWEKIVFIAFCAFMARRTLCCLLRQAYYLFQPRRHCSGSTQQNGLWTQQLAVSYRDRVAKTTQQNALGSSIARGGHGVHTAAQNTVVEGQSTIAGSHRVQSATHQCVWVGRSARSWD